MQATATRAYHPTRSGSTFTPQPRSMAVDDAPVETLPDTGTALLDVFNDVRDSLFSTLAFLLGNSAAARPAPSRRRCTPPCTSFAAFSWTQSDASLSPSQAILVAKPVRHRCNAPRSTFSPPSPARPKEPHP